MKRIAIVSLNGASGGGIESVVRWQMEVLQAAGCKVKLFSAPQVVASARTSKVKRIVNVLMFPLVSSIIARIWAGRSGIVFSHGWSSIGLGCDVVFAHGCWRVVSQLWGVEGSIYSGIVCLYEQLSAHLAKHVVCVSDRVQSDWSEQYGMPTIKSEVSHNACDTKLFSRKVSSIAPATTGQFHVLFVGRLEAWKGLEFLVQLCKEALNTKCCNVALTVCAPTISDVTVASRLEGAEILTDLMPRDLCRLYNAADVLILPSRYESFEMVTIEALCCGTPVMLNDTGTRPYLLSKQCPAVYCLDCSRSALEQVFEARQMFAELDRTEVSSWAKAMFSPEVAANKLLRLAKVK